MQSIKRLCCLFLESQDLEASVSFYTDCFGLRVAERSSSSVALAATASPIRQLVIQKGQRSGLLGVEFAVSSQSDLKSLALTQGVVQYRDAEKLSHPYGEAIVFSDPDNNLIRVRVEDQIVARPQEIGRGLPSYLSHLILNSADAPRMVAFYVDVLGFRISDAYEKGLVTFLKCNQPQHHCLAITPAPRPGLHHFAMDCDDIDSLMKCVGRMRKAGYEPEWGPGRHGPGGNVFCYYIDPMGVIAEFTCEVIQIRDEATWTARVWSRTPEHANVWGTGMPSPRIVAIMSGTGSTTTPQQGPSVE
jgi:catechol-2,3-dioxygenase